jgi:hypothetical protein
MADYADLEIGISRRDEESYTVELRFTQPDDDAEIPQETGVARLDLRQLGRLRLDNEAYGKLLSQSLFADPHVLAAFSEACARTLPQGNDLRVRLFINRSAPELHKLRWETLYDPRDDHKDSWLVNNQSVLFSRYLRSHDWRPIKLRRKEKLRALVAIANPSDLASRKTDDHRFTEVDVKGELERAQKSLGATIKKELVSDHDPASPKRVTLTRLVNELSKGYDILYLVCHGALTKDKKNKLVPHLWLEDDDGTASVESGLEFVDRLFKLPTQPRLIVLASCQSAGTGGEARDSDVEGALASLGPKLAEAGIPAVLGMQGDVTMKTVADFMPEFFKKLNEHGHVEKAMAAARYIVTSRHDSWMPVLFTRLRTGRIWYVPGFRSGDGNQDFARWPALLESIRDEACTPIIGSGVLESLLGSSHDIARNWADDYRFPMAPHDREDLPHVAQFLKFTLMKSFPYNGISKYLHQQIIERYDDILTPELRKLKAKEVSKLLEFVGKDRREHNLDEPHRVLSRLPFKVYITTNLDNLLSEALHEVKKTPHTELCPWNEFIERQSEDGDESEPTVQDPLVYHLFGQLNEPDSIVLTEDDYFDYLIGVTENKSLIHDEVLRAKTDSLLLFLGFQIDDWAFRVIFRSIMRMPGVKAGLRRGKNAEIKHVAVQINPDEDRILDPVRARRYLEEYFNDSKISIYWGSAEDFVRDLREQWNSGKDYGQSDPI